MTPRKPLDKRRLIFLCVLVLACVALIEEVKITFFGNVPIPLHGRIDDPSEFSTWPWPRVPSDSPHPGVTHWLAHAADGTTLDLLRFDFAANPGLRFEIYDQDEDDAQSFDDKVLYWPLGVGQATHHLNAIGRGRVIAAWNGIFFGYDEVGPRHTAYHVSPVVLKGVPHYYNVAVNHRWTFGVKYKVGRPQFKVLFKPDKELATREFDFAAASAQCLIRDGVPLKLQPFPKPGEPRVRQPVPSTKEEVGHIPVFDHMKTCRESIGWTKDSRQLYLLSIKEPDSEGVSAIALLHNTPLGGGWTVADLQRFWKSMGLPNAINSDAGDVGQMVYLRPDGRYEMTPPRWACSSMRQTFGPDFVGAPPGGSLTYFFVSDKR